MKDNITPRKFGRVSLLSILILVAFVACFLGGRTSQETKIRQLESELQLANDKLAESEKAGSLMTKYRVISLQTSQILNRMERTSARSIEQGMKASELELKSRLNGSNQGFSL